MDTQTLLYYGALALWSAFIAYTILFSFRKQQKETVQAPPPALAPVSYDVPRSVPSVYEPTPIPEHARALATDGFRAFQTGDELTVEDIVKGLSRNE